MILFMRAFLLLLDKAESADSDRRQHT